MRQTRTAIQFTLTAAILASSSTAIAQPQQPNGYTWGELATLPEYCRDTQGVLYGDATSPSPRAAHWIGLMGNDFWNMHHYCRALVNVRRAEAIGLPRTQKMVFWAQAVSDFEYATKNSSPSMPLMPEILLKYGDLKLLMDNLLEAKELFDAARKLKPDYWPAYTHWIDVQINLKQNGQAKELAEEGLKYAPGNPELLQRLNILRRPSQGGDKKSVHKVDPKTSVSLAAPTPTGASITRPAAATSER